jgi:hypothetical protein
MLKPMIVAVVMITSVSAQAQQGTSDDKTSTYTAPAAPTTPYNPTLGGPAGSGSDHESKCNAGVCPK